MPESLLPPAVAAFDGIAHDFDRRFSTWRSVAAQRRAVRRHLLRTFPSGSHLLELAGGTGEDALFLAEHGRTVTLTDGSPAMVAAAAAKIRRSGYEHSVEARTLLLEDIGTFGSGRRFDGAYSNFAGLNCVDDLGIVARGLAALLHADAHVLLVMFGPLPPAEIIVELAHGRPRTAFRRLGGGRADARLGGRRFRVSYPSPRAIARAFAPWFVPSSVHGIGIFVPPSAAEPGISGVPRLLRGLELLDRWAARPLAYLGDHVLIDLVRTRVAPEGAAA